MNLCEAGHLDHDLREVYVTWPERKLRMYVYDAATYRDTKGYCTGDDVLSRSLIESGFWEKWDTKLLLNQRVFRGNHVIDVGAHIGWYTLIACSFGCSVTAFEGDKENSQTLRKNVELNGFSGVDIRNEWVHEGWSPDVDIDGPIDLIKVDIEGNDAFAVDGLWRFVESGQVRNLFVEISPVFRDGYPELVERICEAGFSATVADPQPFTLPSYEWVEDCHQVDVLFQRNG